MTSGADPFSVLSKTTFVADVDGQNIVKNKLQAVRYRPGVKPVFEKKSDASDGSGSDEEKDFDMFSDHKTLISKFTLNSSKLSSNNPAEELNKSRILRKNLSTVIRAEDKKSISGSSQEIGRASCRERVSSPV